MYVYRQRVKNPRSKEAGRRPACVAPQIGRTQAHETTPGVACLSVGTWRDIWYVRRRSIVHARWSGGDAHRRVSCVRLGRTGEHDGLTGEAVLAAAARCITSGPEGGGVEEAV